MKRRQSRQPEKAVRRRTISVALPKVTWPFVLVTEGIERIRVMRSCRIAFEGAVPAGFSMHLTIGDSVQKKDPSWNHWKCKFSIEMHSGRPSVRYRRTPVEPEHRVYLDKEPPAPAVRAEGPSS